MAVLKRFWMVIVLPFLIVLAILVAVGIVNASDYHHTDNDFFTFWQAGHLVTQGGSPYDPIQWTAGYHQNDMAVIPNPAFLYPLPLAVLLAPLGLLSFHTAYIVWVTLLQYMILAALTMLLSTFANPRTKLFFLPLLAGVILFRPTTLTLFQGQVSGLFLLIFVLASISWKKEKWALGGFLLGLTALKPNLGAPILILLGIWLLARKHWTGLLGMAGAGIVLLVTGLLYDPGWIGEYWRVGNNKLAETFGGSPTVWGLGALIGHNNLAGTLVVGGIGGLLLVLGFFWLVLRPRQDLQPAALIGLAITVTLLITPYTWTYDQLLLLLPITVVTLSLDQLKQGFLVSASLFIAIDIIAVLILIFDFMLKIEILNFLIPMLVFGLGAWVMTRRPLVGG
jgi:hypothetical protein